MIPALAVTGLGGFDGERAVCLMVEGPPSGRPPCSAPRAAILSARESGRSQLLAFCAGVLASQRCVFLFHMVFLTSLGIGWMGC